METNTQINAIPVLKPVSTPKWVVWANNSEFMDDFLVIMVGQDPNDPRMVVERRGWYKHTCDWNNMDLAYFRDAIYQVISGNAVIMESPTIPTFQEALECLGVDSMLEKGK